MCSFKEVNNRSLTDSNRIKFFISPILGARFAITAKPTVLLAELEAMLIEDMIGAILILLVTVVNDVISGSDDVRACWTVCVDVAFAEGFTSGSDDVWPC